MKKFIKEEWRLCLVFLLFGSLLVPTFISDLKRNTDVEKELPYIQSVEVKDYKYELSEKEYKHIDVKLNDEVVVTFNKDIKDLTCTGTNLDCNISANELHVTATQVGEHLISVDFGTDVCLLIRVNVIE